MHKSRRAACLAQELLAQLAQVLLKPPVCCADRAGQEKKTVQAEVVQAGAEVCQQS